MSERPGGTYANRPLHFIWLLDCSGSMKGSKIQTLNNAIRNVLPEMRAAAENNPEAQVVIRAIKFSNGAQWHIAQETPLKDFKWKDVDADGETDMGKAFSLLAEELRHFPTESRLLAPVLVLISDGKPTDAWKGPLLDLLSVPWAQHAQREAIAVGPDSEVDMEPLQTFINNSERHPLRASNADELVKHLRWVSTMVASTSPGKKWVQPDHKTSPASAPGSVW